MNVVGLTSLDLHGETRVGRATGDVIVLSQLAALLIIAYQIRIEQPLALHSHSQAAGDLRGELQQVAVFCVIDGAGDSRGLPSCDADLPGRGEGVAVLILRQQKGQRILPRRFAPARCLNVVCLTSLNLHGKTRVGCVAGDIIVLGPLAALLIIAYQIRVELALALHSHRKPAGEGCGEPDEVKVFGIIDPAGDGRGLPRSQADLPSPSQAAAKVVLGCIDRERIGSRGLALGPGKDIVGLACFDREGNAGVFGQLGNIVI